MSKVTLKSLSEQILALQQQVESLTAKLAEIEGVGPAATPAATPAPQAQPVEEGISEEVLIAIASAVAAYLGKRAPIRQIRLVSSQAWAQQGRAFIQASHRIDRKQD